MQVLKEMNYTKHLSNMKGLECVSDFMDINRKLLSIIRNSTLKRESIWFYDSLYEHFTYIHIPTNVCDACNTHILHVISVINM